MVSSNYFYLIIIICLHTAIWSQLTNNNLFISYIFINASGWVISDVCFGFMAGGSGHATSDPFAQMTQLALMLLQLPSRQLTCTSTQEKKKKKMTTEKALYIILQQPIRAKLYWWLLNLFFKNRETTWLLLLGRNDVIRPFVHFGMYSPPFSFFFSKLTEKKKKKKKFLYMNIKLQLKQQTPI